MRTSFAKCCQAAVLANDQVPALVTAARERGRAQLGREIDRLIALQQANPGVRDEEIDFLRDQLAHFESALEHARLRLDAARVMVAI